MINQSVRRINTVNSYSNISSKYISVNTYWHFNLTNSSGVRNTVNHYSTKRLASFCWTVTFVCMEIKIIESNNPNDNNQSQCEILQIEGFNLKALSIK